MTNTEWMVKNGYKFSDIVCYNHSCSSDYSFVLNGKHVGAVTDCPAFAALVRWLDMENMRI